MKSLFLSILFFSITPETWAFSWQDLWSTKNHQAQHLMDAGQFSKAQETFEDPAWQATAAYRAGNYKQAAMQYQSLENSADAYYNQGNSLAHSGQLKEAIKAYSNALSLSPAHQDATYNQQVVKKLLEKQNESKQNKQEQNKQQQDKQEQDKQEQNKQEQNKQEQDKQEQDKQEQDKQEQDKQEQDKKDKPLKKSKPSQAEREKQQAKKQWLRLIPDDPGGLMREKFLRDYLSRHRHQGYQ